MLRAVTALWIVECEGEIPRTAEHGRPWPQVRAPGLVRRYWSPEQFLDFTDLCAADIDRLQDERGAGIWKPSAGYFCVQEEEEDSDDDYGVPGYIFADELMGTPELYDNFALFCGESCECVERSDSEVEARRQAIARFRRVPFSFGPTPEDPHMGNGFYRPPDLPVGIQRHSCPAYRCLSYQDCAPSRSKPGCEDVVCKTSLFASRERLGVARCRPHQWKRELTACPCNSSYISEACCWQPEGLVWETADRKLGQLDQL
ncbi:MAG: hypothetical protein M1817_006147 [Caeruleum heppii]|nr:MAG: hypothetical protein M1817_006147 [Caeruleum heppii]